MAVDATVALTGMQSCKSTLDDATDAFLEADAVLQSESEVWVKFYVRFAAGTDITIKDSVYLLRGANEDGRTEFVIKLIRNPEAGPYWTIIYHLRQDYGPLVSAGYSYTSPLRTEHWHCFVVHWKRSTRRLFPNGVAEYWLDGAYMGGVTRLANATSRIGKIQLGDQSANPQITGALYLDDVVVRNDATPITCETAGAVAAESARPR